MTNFDEYLKSLFSAIAKEYGQETADAYIDQIKQLISETIGEDEKMIFDIETQIEKDFVTWRNELRKELRHAFNLKGEH